MILGVIRGDRTMGIVLKHDMQGQERLSIGYTGAYGYVRDLGMDRPLYWSEEGHQGIDLPETISIIGALNKLTDKALKPPVSGTSSERTENPQVGAEYFDTELNKPIWWSGDAWRDGNGAIV